MLRSASMFWGIGRSSDVVAVAMGNFALYSPANNDYVKRAVQGAMRWENRFT